MRMVMNLAVVFGLISGLFFQPGRNDMYLPSEHPSAEFLLQEPTEVVPFEHRPLDAIQVRNTYLTGALEVSKGCDNKDVEQVYKLLPTSLVEPNSSAKDSGHSIEFPVAVSSTDAVRLSLVVVDRGEKDDITPAVVYKPESSTIEVRHADDCSLTLDGFMMVHQAILALNHATPGDLAAEVRAYDGALASLKYFGDENNSPDDEHDRCAHYGDENYAHDQEPKGLKHFPVKNYTQPVENMVADLLSSSKDPSERELDVHEITKLPVSYDGRFDEVFKCKPRTQYEKKARIALFRTAVIFQLLEDRLGSEGSHEMKEQFLRTAQTT